MELPPTWGWGYDKKKPSLMNRLFGKKVEWHEEMYGYPEIKKPKKTKYGKSNLYPLSELPISIDQPPPPIMPYKMPHFRPNYPENFDYLPKSIQKNYMKENKKREKHWKKAQKEQEKLFKIQMKQWEKDQKERLKLEKLMLKKKEKDAMWHYRHPTQPHPPNIPHSLPHQNVRKPPNIAKTTNNPNTDLNNPYNFMLLPATEFGVRRPFNPMIGGTEKWPNMSRTMTHALLDMNREEQLHAYHASLLHTPNW
ncbi:uncharacterized protein L201_007684 [Kwoniella dendrophila CBS 6074]|uniref:Uncharacterized protein n=1 Tax=Kwoniella dendrophila CBS 6074 TaxID=1295534 RepID=A0AAX4K570_9TREE